MKDSKKDSKKDLIIAYESYDSLAKSKFPKQPLRSVNLTQ